jgi:hypothetical protein
MRKSAMFVRATVVALAAGLALSATQTLAAERSPVEAPPAPEPAGPGEAPAQAEPAAPSAETPDLKAPAPPAAEPPSPYSDQIALRTPADAVILFPTARLQVDAAFFPRQTPKSGAFLRRARVGLAGWLGGVFYFDVSVDGTPAPPGGADTVAPAALSPTDDYLAFAPAGDRLILQVGQFDVPFTLENRTSDAYTPFIERSMTVRLLGAPRGKDVGVMAHGLLAGDHLYYSGGIFDGDGPGFRPVDNQPDLIGRVVFSPFGPKSLGIGASGWYGHRVLGQMFPTQATAGGVKFFTPHWVTGQDTPTTMELREHGLVTAYAAELSLPLGRRFGLRGEGVYKRQQLIEADVSLVPAGGPLLPVGGAFLEGLSAYGELWFWLLGDDRLLPLPGLELPRRPEPNGARPFEDGLMLALRGEFLKEDLSVPMEQQIYGDPNKATTRVVAGTLGVNYWRGRLVRLSLNYTVHYWSGTSEAIKNQRALGTLEHEVLLRFAMSL